MRQYTLIFMEHRVGVARLRPMEGEGSIMVFTATDDEAALAYIAEHLLEQLKNCVHAELSSLQIVKDPAANRGIRLVDDTHANPRFQDTYVKYNAYTKTVDVDWDSTRTSLIADFPRH